MEPEQLVLQIPGVGRVTDGAEQLAHLLFQRHSGKGLLHPRDLLIAQIKGFCFQINTHVPDTPFFKSLPMALSILRP